MPDSSRSEKIHQVIIALLQHIENYNDKEDTEWALFSTVSADSAIASKIPIFKTYKQTVSDPEYEKI